MGLAWTAMGGSALYIESSLRKRYEPKKRQTLPDVVPEGGQPQGAPPVPEGSLEATGHLGDVMKESMRTAYTVAKNVMMKKCPNNEFLELAHM